MNGVKFFIDYATEHMLEPYNTFRCPCVICNNAFYKTPDMVEQDLHINGFNRSYLEWIFHGEKEHEVIEDDWNSSIHDEGNDTIDSTPRDELNEFLVDLREALESNNDGDDELLAELREVFESDNDDDEETTRFENVLNGAQCELYPGCKMSLFSAVVRLLHLKVMGKWSNKSFSALLEFLKDMLPDGETLPSSLYGALKMLDEVGLGYEEIDACKNDCILFRKENQDATRCPVCNESRWQNNYGKRKPHKTLRYFPLKPRLQKLFMFRKTASKMRWHEEKRVVEEGIARHPADLRAWKHFDNQFPEFSADSRNVRLGLASDGFTPWSNQSSSHSMWPVVLAVYNLPPYDCMRSSYLMLSLLIPGPRSPGKDIDIYLQPLLDDLIELWEVGIETFDISSKSKFQMHAAILWTISDFPGYSPLSGWSTSGHYACPCCLSETDFKQLRTKTCYMGHRRFLPKNHPFRKNRHDFNGEEDHRVKPRKLSGANILHWLNSLHENFDDLGKKNRKGKRKRVPEQVNWYKLPCLFQLPYWQFLLIRNNLDPMHVEKNISENVLVTLFDIKGKTKDPEVAQEDLRDMGIRRELHIKVRARGNKAIKPPACFTLSLEERIKFREFLKSVKYPDGFAANISKCIKKKTISGLKSHDCHVLLQRLIPAGVRGFLPREVSEALFELGDYFKELCSKTLKRKDLTRLRRYIPGKMKIVFNPYEKYPTAFDHEFSEGIGVSVRTCADLIGVNMWRDVPETNREVVHKCLLQWFEIEDWQTERVQHIMNQKFQARYRRWRHTLAKCYRQLKDKGLNPKEKCPRDEVSMTKWHVVCEYIESGKFQVKQSKIILWRSNHVKKSGEFVNDLAKSTYDKMIEYETISMEEGREQMSEDDILVAALGRRSGYQKGMGYGVEVSRGTNAAKTFELQAQLQNSNDKIEGLTIQLGVQIEENKNNNEKIISLDAQLAENRKENESNKEVISNLQSQMNELMSIVNSLSASGNVVHATFPGTSRSRK